MKIAAGAQVDQAAEPGGGVPSGTESTLKLIDAIAGDAGRVARGELPDEEVAEITEGNRIRATQMEGYVAGEEIRQSVREVEQDRRDRNAEHEARKAADEAVVETDALIAHPRRVLGIE